jgi:effector-binding domain-containing protein
MKFLKKAGVVLVILFAVYLIACLFLPGVVVVEREKNIKADQSALFGLVNTIKKWNYWNPWNKLDPEWKVEYFGPDDGNYSGYDWKSERSDLGNGRLFITNSVPNDSITVKIYFEGRDTSLVKFYFTAKDSFVNVKQTMVTKVGFLQRVFPGLMIEKMIGKYFDQGLNSLDSLSKTPIAIPAAGISGIKSFTIKNALSVLDSCPEKDLSFQIAKAYQRIQDAMTADMQMAGSPFCIYHAVSADKVVFEAALPVNKVGGKSSDPAVKAISVNEKKVLVYNFFGSYSEIRNGYAKIAEYLEEKNLKQNGNSMEEFVSDRMAETDPDKWLTKIYVPVE